jgi:hypothetical protein
MARMAHIQVDRDSKKWLYALPAALVLASVAWWYVEGQGTGAAFTTADKASNKAATGAQGASALALPGAQGGADAGLQGAAPPAAADMAPTPAQMAAIEAQQREAARVIEREPSLAPLKGAVKSRPPFVSEMEWQMLQGVAQQQVDPTQALTNLVNTLRFNKQREAWEAQGHSTDASLRRALAESLLSDLPARVAQGDVDLAEARRLQASLLPDAVSDQQDRKQRAAAEAQRLVAPESSAR